jgi:uncharacterized lipoprotein YehR (DUF1307 family)
MKVMNKRAVLIAAILALAFALTACGYHEEGQHECDVWCQEDCGWQD